MKLSDLLSQYGDENIIFQTLDSDIKELNLKKNHTEIKFGTSETFNHKGTVKMGLVVWLDRNKVQQIINAKKDKQWVR